MRITEVTFFTSIQSLDGSRHLFILLAWIYWSLREVSTVGSSSTHAIRALSSSLAHRATMWWSTTHVFPSISVTVAAQRVDLSLWRSSVTNTLIVLIKVWEVLCHIVSMEIVTDEQRNWSIKIYQKCIVHIYLEYMSLICYNICCIYVLQRACWEGHRNHHTHSTRGPPSTSLLQAGQRSGHPPLALV